jgi:MYXO-CTERM domain-containing protein
MKRLSFAAAALAASLISGQAMAYTVSNSGSAYDIDIPYSDLYPTITMDPFVVARDIVGGLFSSHAFDSYLTWIPSVSCGGCTYGSGPTGTTFTFSNLGGLVVSLGHGGAALWEASLSVGIRSVVGNLYTFDLRSVSFTSGQHTETVAYNPDGVVPKTSLLITPGPISGAGLPAVLGLLGFAAWRRRQQAA